MIENNELLSIVPHRGKMLLLSRINKYDLGKRSVEAEYDITEDCLFYNSSAGGVPVWVSFEFAAQAIAAVFGLDCRARGIEPKMGYILSVSTFGTGLSFFKKGCIVKINAKEIEQVDSVSIYESEIFLEEKQVLNCKLTVYELNDEENKNLKGII